jgi:hypothetical protein
MEDAEAQATAKYLEALQSHVQYHAKQVALLAGVEMGIA